MTRRVFGWTVYTREGRCIHNDYSALPHRKGMPEGHAEAIRELVVPIMRLDRVVAILGIWENKPANYNENDVAMVSNLADVAWEIAERKQAEDSLRKSEEQFRTLVGSAPDAILILREGRFFVYANDAAVRLYGATFS